MKQKSGAFSPLKPSKKSKNLRNGKEASYARNPGGVSCVFDHKFFGTF